MTATRYQLVRVLADHPDARTLEILRTVQALLTRAREDSDYLDWKSFTVRIEDVPEIDRLGVVVAIRGE